MRASELCLTAYQAGLSQYGKIKYDNSYPNNVMKFHYAENCWTADCLGFVHTMVNGFAGNRDELGGGAVMDDFVLMSDEYTTLTKHCYNQSGDFNYLTPGEFLYMPGHVGLYIGDHEPFNDGRVFNVAECCYSSWGGGGLLSYVDTFGIRKNHKNGSSAGNWTQHAKFYRVDYSDADQIIPNPDTGFNMTPAEVLNVVNDTFVGVYGNNPEREETLVKKYGKTVHRQVQDILNILYR